MTRGKRTVAAVVCLVALLAVAGAAGCGGSDARQMSSGEAAQTVHQRMVNQATERGQELPLHDVRCMKEPGRNQFACVAYLGKGKDAWTVPVSFRCDSEGACLLKTE